MLRADTSSPHSTSRAPVSSLYARTSGSAGMDLATAESVTLETSEVKAVATGVWGPLEGNKSALLIGRSSTTLQGLFVLPGVIDADYQGEIKIMVWTPMPPCFVPAGSRIALLVGFNIQPSLAAAKTRDSGGFGSTGVPHIFWAQRVSNSRPTLSCRWNGEILAK